MKSRTAQGKKKRKKEKKLGERQKYISAHVCRVERHAGAEQYNVFPASVYVFIIISQKKTNRISSEKFITLQARK